MASVLGTTGMRLTKRDGNRALYVQEVADVVRTQLSSALPIPNFHLGESYTHVCWKHAADVVLSVGQVGASMVSEISCWTSFAPARVFMYSA